MSRDPDPPFFAGSILGIRSWTVEEIPPSALPGGLALGAIAADARWETGGEWTSAGCRVHRRRGGHRAPEPGCSCGLYAWHPRPAAASELRAATWSLGEARGGDPALPELAGVAGVIEACGRIEVHEDGFRAQRARVRALVIGSGWPPRAAATVRRLARIYGAEAIELDQPRELLAYCERLGGALAPERVEQILHPGHSRLRRRARLARGRWAGRWLRWGAWCARRSARIAGGWERLRQTTVVRGALRAGELAVAGLGWLLLISLGVLWYGGIAAICVMGAGAVLFGWFEREPKPPPARVSTLRVDRERCRVEAVIVARRSVPRVVVRVSGRDERGAGLGHLQRPLGAVAAGRSRVPVAVLDRRLCRSPLGFTARVRLVWPGRLGRPVVASSPPRGPPGRRGRGSAGRQVGGSAGRQEPPRAATQQA